MSESLTIRVLATRVLSFALCMAPSLAGAAPSSGYPVSIQRVVEAVTAKGYALDRSQVPLLSEVRIAGGDPNLQVVSMSPAIGGVKVRLRCQRSTQCVPFYVLVHDLSLADESSTSVATTRSMVEATKEQHLIRRGDPATLIMETNDARIKLPVICLESGERGEKIRVRTKDHFRFYRAEIITSGLLRAEL